VLLAGEEYSQTRIAQVLSGKTKPGGYWTGETKRHITAWLESGEITEERRPHGKDHVRHVYQLA
jgi:hypothetical protein